MSLNEGDPQMSQDFQALAASLVDAFVQGGKARPLLPAGRRDEVVAALTALLIDAEAMDRYLRDLESAQRDAGVYDLLLGLESPELPVEDVVARGIAALTDEQLAYLAIDPVRLAGLFELLGECMEDEVVGEVWFRALADTDRADLEARGQGDMAQQLIRRLKAIDAAADPADESRRPD
jgi:hypothetical protein